MMEKKVKSQDVSIEKPAIIKESDTKQKITKTVTAKISEMIACHQCDKLTPDGHECIYCGAKIRGEGV
jgi:hypothetical protein